MKGRYVRGHRLNPTLTVTEPCAHRPPQRHCNPRWIQKKKRADQ